MKTDCPHLEPSTTRCAHPKSVLSNGQPYISCQALRELKAGCPVKEGK